MVQLDDELPVVIPAASADRLQGARLEWSDEGDGGLVLVNPNLPTPQEAAPGVPAELLAAGLDGPLALRVHSGARGVGEPVHRLARRPGRPGGHGRGGGRGLPEPVGRLPGLCDVPP